MLYSDYHIHTNYSPDGESDMETMIEASIAKGLKEIALTDHVDDNIYTPLIDYGEYFDSFNACRDKYSGRITLIFGVEIGLGPGMFETASLLVQKYPFDFVIGSSHAVNGADLYYDNYCRGKDKKTAYTNYFIDMIENIDSTKELCVYGHLDFISRYGVYADNSVAYEEYRDIIDDVLKKLIESGKGIEINTSGYRYGINGTYPQLSILKRYKELGGEIVTIGSDAHNPNDIAGRFDAAYDMLETVGFKYITLYRNLKPVFHPVT